MKISDLILRAQAALDTFGDYEVTKLITGGHEQYKPVDIGFEVCKGAWIKTRMISEDEEVIIKRRVTLFKIQLDEDVKSQP